VTSEKTLGESTKRYVLENVGKERLLRGNDVLSFALRISTILQKENLSKSTSSDCSEVSRRETQHLTSRTPPW
jgi:hypothetical protein